ncbi:DUF4352 domain-containing protein [Methanocaldococcus indicus]|uniref:DUF4352 domain-containing protein n=1 Tax=Methanocaldococcus indicus TaxID=213231 RepID=UPI003C6D1672
MAMRDLLYLAASMIILIFIGASVISYLQGFFGDNGLSLKDIIENNPITINATGKIAKVGNVTFELIDVYSTDSVNTPTGYLKKNLDEKFIITKIKIINNLNTQYFINYMDFYIIDKNGKKYEPESYMDSSAITIYNIPQHSQYEGVLVFKVPKDLDEFYLVYEGKNINIPIDTKNVSKNVKNVGEFLKNVKVIWYINSSMIKKIEEYPQNR